VAVDEVTRSMQRLISDGRHAVAPALLHARESKFVHRPLDGAARDGVALAIELLPDLLRAVDAVEAGVVDPFDLRLQALVTLSSS
jgi:hypothetical protein